MPSPTYKPLFNRRYLFWLMWIIAIAVVLLSATGREKSVSPLAISWQDSPAHWRLSLPNHDVFQLTALQSLPAGWSLQHRLSKAAYTETLQTWLNLDTTEETLAAFGWQADIKTTLSTLTLTFFLEEEPDTQQLEWLTASLEQLQVSNASEENRVIAAWQLDQRDAENRMLAELESWLYQHSIGANPWTFLLSAEKIDSGIHQQAPSSLYHEAALALESNRQDEAFVSGIHQLNAWQIPLAKDAMTLAKNRVAVTAIQSALNSLPDRPDFRLIWNPLPPKSYLAILLTPEQLHDALAEELLALASESVIENAIQQVLSEHIEPSSSAHDALEWFELSALLNFPAGADQRYLQAIQALTTDDIQRQIRLLLNRDHQLSLMLRPY